MSILSVITSVFEELNYDLSCTNGFHTHVVSTSLLHSGTNVSIVKNTFIKNIKIEENHNYDTTINTKQNFMSMFSISALYMIGDCREPKYIYKRVRIVDNRQVFT